MNNILSKPEGTLAKHQIVQLLDGICQAIEPTETQYTAAGERYDTIGKFLAEEGSPLHCFEPVVYPQGSMRIKTAIKPTNGKEFDVDLVCEFKKMPHDDPKVVKQLVLARFLSSDRYRDMTVEKNRCVQLQYAGDFHMDVMPCVPGQAAWAVTPVSVPDKKLDDWKPSNPIGFARFVEEAAAKAPKQLVLLANAAMPAKAAEVQPLDTERTFSKPALIRIVQILKRHRDEHFQKNHDEAPISIIITTLATHSYDRCVSQNTYDSVYDLMLDVVAGMLAFIKVNPATSEFWIANPSHPEENFAERWNSNPALADAFFKWQRIVVGQLKALAEHEAAGLDKIGKTLESAFGATAANSAIRAFSARVRDGNAAGKIGVTPAGLVVPLGSNIQSVTKSPRHTNYGS
jgi:hypothetical protein